MFSIVVPTYSRRQLLEQALESVLLDTGEDYEVCVCDDGSIDDTKEYLSALAERLTQRSHASSAFERFRFVSIANAGEAQARNAAAALARGEWLLFLDDDDTLAPGAIEVLRGVVADNPEACVIKTTFRSLRDGEGERSGRGESRADSARGEAARVERFTDLLESLSTPGGFTGIGGTLIRRHCVLPHPFGESRLNCADVLMQLRHSCVGPALRISSPPLWCVREHAGRVSIDPQRVLEGAASLLDAERNGQFPGGPARSRDRARVLANQVRHAVRVQLRHKRVVSAISLAIKLAPVAWRARQFGFALEFPLKLLRSPFRRVSR